jgi:type II secretory pathway pseudopilin PulG
MRPRPRIRRPDAPRARRAGFTLAEVLAALLFMAIVIPVAVHGVRIASQAGLVAHRKLLAARHAERLLNEAVVTGQWRSGVQAGTLQDGSIAYRWQLRIEPWDLGLLRQATVQVAFPVQGQDYDVRLSTLVDTTTP